MAKQEELLTVAALARRLGVAPATLRTWDRRYGLGPSAHAAGAHRRYRPHDVARLMMMRRLISTGVAPSEAAEQAKSHKGSTHLEEIHSNFSSRKDLVKAIYKAANKFDTPFIHAELKRDLATHGVVSSWSAVVVPVLIMIGKSWEETAEGIEVEHLLTEVIKSVLRDTVQPIQSPLNARPVVLAAVGQEIHVLALHALAAALSERRIQTHFLGSRTPPQALHAMVSRSAPPAVFLWAQLSENACPEFFRDLPKVRPAPRIVLGGPGWNRDECVGVAFAHDISQACLEIERAVGL